MADDKIPFRPAVTQVVATVLKITLNTPKPTVEVDGTAMSDVGEIELCFNIKGKFLRVRQYTMQNGYVVGNILGPVWKKTQIAYTTLYVNGVQV